ncbi:27547_t:CDS:2, partial [Gigaspora margarita]
MPNLGYEIEDFQHHTWHITNWRALENRVTGPEFKAGDDEPSKSISLALQRVFYSLQTSNIPVGTTELTKSFGWDSSDSYLQHDVQEFNRVLQDNLECEMKWHLYQIQNTNVDSAISRLFAGKMKSYIKCVNVDYESSQVEDYYDIQLNVKGCKNLDDSFKNYIKEANLKNETKYQTEGYGLQNAKKSVIFESFPPVLHLQLKRFEYNVQKNTIIKINDRYEFPMEIDLQKYLSPEADRLKSYKYLLHG